MTGAAAPATGRVKVAYRDGISFEVADRPGKGVFVVLGVRKSGSSILNSMLQALAEFNDVNYVDVAGTLFEHGLAVQDWQCDRALGELLRPGNLYGGFRDLPLGLAGHPAYESARKILLVRDPRDALVSLYYSDAFSHSVPAAGVERESMRARRDEALACPVGEYAVRMAPSLRQTLREYMQAASDPALKIFKYEDVILRKRQFLFAACGCFCWRLTEQYAADILSWADVFPSEEDPHRFTRHVTPGDYRNKLPSDVIEQLNRMLSEEMEFFGYAGETSRWRRLLRGWHGSRA